MSVSDTETGRVRHTLERVRHYSSVSDTPRECARHTRSRRKRRKDVSATTPEATRSSCVSTVSSPAVHERVRHITRVCQTLLKRVRLATRACLTPLGCAGHTRSRRKRRNEVSATAPEATRSSCVSTVSSPASNSNEN